MISPESWQATPAVDAYGQTALPIRTLALRPISRRGSTALRCAAFASLLWACAELHAQQISLTGRGAETRQMVTEPKPDPSFPFSTEIEDFARADKAGPAIPDATLFMGSSSIRLWDIQGSFPGIATVNRGFGGATTPDVLHYYSRLRPRVAPISVVVYVGENDLAAGALPEKIARDILILIGKLRSDYPKARILWMSLKPSPIRWPLWPRMAMINGLVSARTRAVGFDYRDVGKGLLAGDGLPNASLFRSDGLHMNAQGYLLWTRLIETWLTGADPAKVKPRPVMHTSVRALPVFSAVPQ